MDIVKVPQIRLYWSKNKRIKNSMSREQFLDILQYWYFSDGDQICSDIPLHKINTFVKKDKPKLPESNETWERINNRGMYDTIPYRNHYQRTQIECSKL